MKTFSKHPYSFFSNSLDKRFPGMVLEFSEYISGGPGITLKREIFTISDADISETWLNQKLLNLGESKELAIHSRVMYNGCNMHIPMVDFYINPEKIDTDKISIVLKEKFKADCYFFFTGNSLHCYLNNLLSPQQWYNFLGTILLLNPSDQYAPPLIDSRWVGHSLENGFSALRWSNNSKNYLQMPILKKIA